jgi:hypothetical protein
MRAVRLLLLLSVLLLGGTVAVAPTAGAHERCTSAGWIPDPGDQDCDGVRNDGNGPVDNCPSVRNADQRNTDAGYTAGDPPAQDDASAVMVDGDASGDACDDDDDADGVPDERDTDGDGAPDTLEDNCRTVRNPHQYGAKTTYGGTTQDGTPLCPAKDGDGDGHNDDVDNCRFIANPDQQDLDSDGLGDVCEGDDDGDGVADGADNCPKLPNSDQEDADGDGTGRICDFDEQFPSQPIVVAAADRTAPGLRVTMGSRHRVDDLAGGLPTAVRCDEACALSGTLRLSPATARRLHLPRVLARSTAFVDAAGRTFLFWRPAPRVTRALRRHRVRVRMSVTAKDGAGNARSARRRVTLVP